MGGYLINKHAPLGGHRARETGVARICPMCQFENSGTSTQCSKCGAVLQEDESREG
ncbi:MAG: hypothetical protein ACFFFG_18845 [Candidatus Thorarchaeota archaeon]